MQHGWIRHYQPGCSVLIQHKSDLMIFSSCAPDTFLHVATTENLVHIIKCQCNANLFFHTYRNPSLSLTEPLSCKKVNVSLQTCGKQASFSKTDRYQAESNCRPSEPPRSCESRRDHQGSEVRHHLIFRHSLSLIIAEHLAELK